MNIIEYITCIIHRKKINIDIDNIIINCTNASIIENNDEYDAKYSHDNYCPKCKSGKLNIVDKISDVTGYYKNNEFEIITKEINHCNTCGNEWKKYNLRIATYDDMLIIALNYITDENLSKYTWKLEFVDSIFKNSYAETIILLYSKNKNNLKNKLNKSLIYSKYKSINEKL